MEALALSEKEERTERVPAVLVSVGVHAIIIIILLLIKIAYEAPPPDENDSGGILINFGNSATGSGDQIPQSTTAGQRAPNVASSASDAENNNVVTQDEEPAVVVKKSTVKKKNIVPVTTVKTAKTKSAPVVVTTPVAKPAEKPKALFPGSANNNVSSQGNTGGTGDQGKPNGSPYTNGQSDIGGGTNPMGKGGPGIGLNMKGRVIVKYPSITDNSQETGKVVINITVDKTGKIVEAVYTQGGSTTSNAHLIDLAKKAAFRTSVNPSTDNIEQHGSITFNFKVK